TYKGIFTITGKLVNATYNPHLFKPETAQIAYRMVTPIKEHHTQKIRDLTKEYTGCYFPRGDYQGSCIARLSNGMLRVSIVGNSQFWNICNMISNVAINHQRKTKMSIGYYGKKQDDKFSYCSAVKPGETGTFLVI
ncbi:hypothetical protein, partial [Limnospira platensis]|uniref:hypothetical protein n=2 Tax=Limnospira platensis TaxID=118562 RepID=UPI00087090F3